MKKVDDLSEGLTKKDQEIVEKIESKIGKAQKRNHELSKLYSQSALIRS